MHMHLVVYGRGAVVHPFIARMFELEARHHADDLRAKGESGMYSEYAVWLCEDRICVHVFADNAEEANDKAVLMLKSLLVGHGHEEALTLADVSTQAELV